MSVFRWIIAVLATLAIGAIWWMTVVDVNAAADTLQLAASVLKGAFGLISTYLIASLLLRKHS